MPEPSTGPAVRIREGRHGRELRVSGTLASLYRPGHATTGLIWDALAAPLTLVPPARRRSVLILGLGGGSAARVVRALAPEARIVGVELAADVVHAARRHLELDRLDLEIHIMDARLALERERSRYDLVLEDVFEGGTHNLRKPAWMLNSGFSRAASLLNDGGLLVSNTIDETGDVTRRLLRHWPAVAWISTDQYENRMVVGGRGVDARGLRNAVAAEPLLAEVFRRLSFRTVTR